MFPLILYQQSLCVIYICIHTSTQVKHTAYGARTLRKKARTQAPGHRDTERHMDKRFRV